MKKIIASLGITLLLSTSLAHSELPWLAKSEALENKKSTTFRDALLTADKSESQEKQAVYQVAKNYGMSIACSTTFESDGGQAERKTTLKDIYTLKSSSKDEDAGWSDYLIFWGGDSGCAGGSGTYYTHLTNISRASSLRPFTVQETGDVFTQIEEINSRFVTSVTFTPEKHLIVIGSNYCNCKNDGGNNMPANNYRYELAQIDGQWKLVNKKLLSTN